MSLHTAQNDAETDNQRRDRTVVRIENLKKTFDGGETVAVDDVSFEVGANQITGFLGPSGCGKTTTLRCIAGVETPDSGTIHINDQKVFSDETNLNPEERDLGMVYQNYAIWPHLTVYENVAYPLRYADDIPKSEYEERVMNILELVQIEELRDSPATDLSGGQQQRTALARAVVHDPDIVLLDEPLSNLDVKLRNTMRKEIQRLQYELDLTMIYVTHDQEEAFFLADDILIMDNGRLVEKGPPAELYASPQKAFTRGFVGRWNELNGEVVGDSEIKTNLFTLEGVDFDVPRGESVLCYIRPTDIEVTSEGAEPGDDYTRIEGTIISEGLLGELYEVTVDLADTADIDADISRNTELTIHTLEHANYTRGEQLTAHIDPENVQVYLRGDR